MIITSGGSVLIGTTTAFAPSHKLMVRGDSSTTPDPIAVYSNNPASNYQYSCYNNTTYMGGIQAAAGNTITINYSSDRRLKTDIQPMESMIDKIMQLQPVKYKWKQNNISDYGFIAQDYQKVFKHHRQPLLKDKMYGGCGCCVSEECVEECMKNDENPTYKRINPETNQEEEVMLTLTVDYGRVTPYLTKALQETITMVNELKDENASLKQQLTNLQNKYDLLEDRVALLLSKM